MELAEDYLTQYGYMKKTTSHQLSSLQKLDHAITKFQEFAGLDVTGQLNQETVEMMKKPRCGVKDFDEDIAIREDIDKDKDADTPGVLSRKKVSRFEFLPSISYFDYRDTCCKDQDGE